MRVPYLHLFLLFCVLVKTEAVFWRINPDQDDGLIDLPLTSTRRDWFVIFNLAGQSQAIPPIGIWNSGGSWWQPENDPAITPTITFCLQNGNFDTVQVNPRGNPIVYHNLRVLSSAGYSGFLNRLWIASADGLWSWNLNQSPDPGAWTPATTVTPATYGIIQQIVPIDLDNGNFVLLCTNKGQTLWLNSQTLQVDRRLSNVGPIDCVFSRFISVTTQDSTGSLSGRDYVISAWPFGLYIITNLAYSQPTIINIDQPYENMTSFLVYRPAGNRGVWLIKGFSITSSNAGKITIHDLTGTQIQVWDFAGDPVTKLILSNEADGTDCLISGHANGTIYKIRFNNVATFSGPIALTPHLASNKNPVTALASNFLLSYEGALPCIIAGFRDGTVSMLLSNSTRWIPLVSPLLFNYNFYYYAGISAFHFQPSAIKSDDFPINNLVIAFSNGTIVMLQPPNNDQYQANFLVETPSQRYTTYERGVITDGMEPKQAIKYQLRKYGAPMLNLTTIMFFTKLSDEEEMEVWSSNPQDVSTYFTRYGLVQTVISSQVTFTFLSANVILNNFISLELKEGTRSLILSVTGYSKNSQAERADVVMVWCTFPNGSYAEISYDILVAGYVYNQVTYTWVTTTITTQ